jgi:uncharacterized protein (DUF983 family)
MAFLSTEDVRDLGKLLWFLLRLLFAVVGTIAFFVVGVICLFAALYFGFSMLASIMHFEILTAIAYFIAVCVCLLILVQGGEVYQRWCRNHQVEWPW